MALNSFLFLLKIKSGLKYKKRFALFCVVAILKAVK